MARESVLAGKGRPGVGEGLGAFEEEALCFLRCSEHMTGGETR